MSQKKIALVERLYHHDTIQMMREYFADVGYECEYVVGEYVYGRMDDHDTKATVLPQPQRSRRQSGRTSQSGFIISRLRTAIRVRREIQCNIRQTYRHIRTGTYDHIYLNTTNKFFCRPMGLIFLFQRSKLIAMLHNTNLRIWGASIRNAWTSVFLRVFYRQVPVFVLLGEYIRLPRCVRHGHHIYTLNRIVQNRPNHIERSATESLRIFIPGAIIPGRRNKFAIYQILSSLAEYDIQCHLMSGKRDDEITQRLRNEGLDHITQTHPGFVSERDYKTLFRQSHITLLVIDQANPDYGIYQITGTLGDAFAYGGVAMIPHRYAADHDFGPGVIRYTPESVAQQLAPYLQQETIQTATYGQRYERSAVVEVIQNVFS